jgi:hypothetical protein
MHRIKALLLSSLIVGAMTSCAPSSSQPTVVPPEVPLRPEFSNDIQEIGEGLLYDIDLSVDPSSSCVTGHQDVLYTNSEEVPLDNLYLRLFPSTTSYGGAMTVTNLLLGGSVVTPAIELEGSALRLPMHPALLPGQTVTLSMDFVTDVPRDGIHGFRQLSSYHRVMALPNIYPLIPIYDDEGWNVEIAPSYGDATYSDVAVFQVRVTAPNTITLITTGSCTIPAVGTWDCTAGPVRDFMLVASDRYQMESRLVEGTVVNSFFFPEHEREGSEVLQIAVDALVTFSELFGPYPYAELDVVETPTRAGGIEYPGLVVIGERLYDTGARLEWVVAHEVAHQWWYAIVGNDQVDEPWLDESLAQYSTLLYYERIHGARAAEDILDDQFRYAHTGLMLRGDDRPVGLPVAAYSPNSYVSVVYDKGPLYFHSLRERVGDESFFAILQTYYARHRYRIATADSFLTTVQIVTGDRQVDLYEEWILGTSNQ